MSTRLAAPERTVARTGPGDAVLAERLLSEAARLVAARRPEEARPLLCSAARDLGEPAAWAPLAELLLILDAPQDAIEACDRGLEQGAGPAALLVCRARAQGRLGRIEAALADAAQAVGAAPRDEAARTVLGQALLVVGRRDEAIAVLGELWREAPEDAARALRLADALLATGAHEAAAELIEWLLGAELAPLHRQQACALAAQNALASGAAADALDRARAALAGQEATGEPRWVAALHSIAGHALIRLRRGAEAAPHILAAHRLMPGDRYLAHLAATAGASAPDRASDDYVRHLFDGYAGAFEESLLGLGYRAPGLILRLLDQYRPGAMLGDVLDLGCGTGLIGVVLHDRLGAGLRGVDLSAAMLAEASAKGIYTALEFSDIAGWLVRDTGLYEVVIAADVFCYFGALGDTLAAIRPRLQPGGLLMFTVEAGAEAGWELLPSGRYRHGEAGLRAALSSAGFEVLTLRREVLRHEENRPLDGFLVAARAMPPA